jgi:hypothetical protein
MVAIRFPKVFNKRSVEPATESHPQSPKAVRFVQPGLAPRTHASDAPPQPRSETLMGRIGSLFRSHDRPVAGVMLGATAMPMLMGFTSVASAAETSVFTREMTPEQRFEVFKQKLAEINAKKDTVPYSDLVKARDALYLDYARCASCPGMAVDQDRDGVNLAKEMLFGSDDKKVDTDSDGMSDRFEIEKGLDPADAQAKGTTDVKTWTHGYIPMSKNPMIEGYTLLYYDLLMRDATGTDPASRHIEGKSALEGGHYFLSTTLDEKDAEMTSGKDFNGDGVLTPGVKHDFLSPGIGDADFGPDGKTETTLSVGWWGHCNDVATAGINFREPTKDVKVTLASPYTVYLVETKHGEFKAESVKKGLTHTNIKLISGQTVRLANADVTKVEKNEIKELTFTPTMLKELASELAHRGSKDGTDWIGSRFYGRPATIELADGTVLRGGVTSPLDDRAKVTEGGWTTATGFTKDVTVQVFDQEQGSYVTKTYKPSELKKIYAENARDVNPVEFHTTMLKWLGSEKKAGVMDKDSGPHVWNYSFDRYDYEHKARADDPNTFDYTMKVYFVGNSYPTTYEYSITYENGQPKASKWSDSSPNPDFFWRDRGGVEAYDHDHGDDATPLNYDKVMELLNKSYAAEDAAH